MENSATKSKVKENTAPPMMPNEQLQGASDATPS